MGRKKRRRRADRERASERDQADEDERTADAAHDSAAGTPLGVPDAPIPDSPMPDAPMPDAGVPDMGMGGNQQGSDVHIQRTPDHQRHPGDGRSDAEGVVSELQDRELDPETIASLERLFSEDTLRALLSSKLDDEAITDLVETSIDNVRNGSTVNEEFPAGWEDPYPGESLVTEFVTQQDEQFVRVHHQDNQEGAFVMRKRDVEGLTAEEIQRKFSLTYEPTYVSDVSVPSGTRMRLGEVEANFGGDHGATQFELLEMLSDDKFTNQRKLPK